MPCCVPALVTAPGVTSWILPQFAYQLCAAIFLPGLPGTLPAGPTARWSSLPRPLGHDGAGPYTRTLPPPHLVWGPMHLLSSPLGWGMPQPATSAPLSLHSEWQVVAWNMRGYSTEKLDHLSLVFSGSAQQRVLAYLLQETHLPAGTVLLGTPADYRVL